MTDVRTNAIDAVDGLVRELIALSHEIHALAEVKFEEHQSVIALTRFLAKHGFSIEAPAAGLSTAFIARSGASGPRLGLVAEYDALPGIGHGCGHNMIGPISVGAAVAATMSLATAGMPAQVNVIGTPAEEGGGGKVHLVKEGVFDGYDAVAMLHPYYASMRDHGTLAMASIRVTYRGKTAHASAQPQEGINALEAAVQAYTAINGLRQHLPSSVRIHGIIREGGQAPNVVPDRSVLEFMVRAPETHELQRVKGRAISCFQAAAMATGCQCNVDVELEYQARVPNERLQDVVATNLSAFGFNLGPLPAGDGRGSSDMGDVSRVAPTVQPYFAICDEPIPWHSTDVTQAAISKQADSALVQVSKGLAAAYAQLATTPDLLAEIREEFDARSRRNQ